MAAAQVGRALLLSLAACAAIAQAAPVRERNDYANERFRVPLSAGLKHFYAKDFGAAQADFERALGVVPDNTLAIAFLNAAALQRGALDRLTDGEEDAVSAAPKDYVDHVRLGFSYMFAALAGRERLQDAREEFEAGLGLRADAPAANVGLGIMRFDERSPNRAKLELQKALASDPNDVLAREYLGELAQTDLRDSQRGLAYVIDLPYLVPGYADIRFHIGALLYDLGQRDAALAFLRSGLALDPGHVGEAGRHGYTLIARIYIDERRLADATAVLEESIAADADAIYAKTLLSKIKNGDYRTTPSPSRTGT